MSAIATTNEITNKGGHTIANHLNSIYQRLQSNYSDCDISMLRLLTVKRKNGIKSGQTVFVPAEDGKTVQELLENDDNLHMNGTIIHSQEGEQMPHNR